MKLGAAVAVATGIVLSLMSTTAVAQTSTCPVGGKGPLTLAVYAVDKCVGSFESPISGYSAAAFSANAAQYCSLESASGDATLGQGLINQAATYQGPVAGWQQASEAYFDAEKSWYAKHAKRESAKQRKTSDKLVKAINGVIPTIDAMAAGDTSFDADLTAAGTAYTSQDCAQVETSLSQAATDQQTAEGAQTRFSNAFEVIITIVSAKGYKPA
jgi:hypothetical protein